MPTANRIGTHLNLKATIATQSDTPQIVRLCRRAVSKSDYAIRILPSIKARGPIFLAWDGNELVGMTGFEECVDGSGWLSVARTDPNWRGLGVARFLQREIATYAKRDAIGPLRLWVEGGNRASLRACDGGGFKRVCEAALVASNLKVAKAHEVARNSLPEKQLPSLLKSPHLVKTRGYIGYKRHFVKLTLPLLMRLRHEGQLYATREGGVLLVTPPETIFRAPQSNLVILWGAFAQSLRQGKEIAQGLGARILSCYIPYRPYEISVAKHLGFRRRPWGRHCIVFEKRIS